MIVTVATLAPWRLYHRIEEEQVLHCCPWQVRKESYSIRADCLWTSKVNVEVANGKVLPIQIAFERNRIGASHRQKVLHARTILLVLFCKVKYAIKKVQKFYDIIREDVKDCGIPSSNTLKIIASWDNTRGCLGAWLCFCKNEQKQQDFCQWQSLIHLFFGSFYDLTKKFRHRWWGKILCSRNFWDDSNIFKFFIFWMKQPK